MKKCFFCKGDTYILRKSANGILYRCNGCKSEYIDSVSTDINYNKDFFISLSGSHYDKIIRAKTNNFITLIVNNFIDLRNSILLDIGCGIGVLLSAASSFGPLELYGLDVSEWAINEAKQSLPDARLFCGSIDDAINSNFIKNDYFDIITVTDVIEHINASDINRFIANLLRLLKEDGRLIFTTPNINSLSRILLGSLWFHYQNEHTTFISNKAFNQLSKDLNFNIEKYIPYKKTLPIGYIFSILKYHTKGPIRWLGIICLFISKALLMNELTFSFQTGELLLIISKKN
ncbi:MAG: class I SAM-dependent methyltransferase [Nitrospirae bacterium]|nr:class I SAM-dependent methyltransferase [Nitrospirota bacterium]